MYIEYILLSLKVIFDLRKYIFICTSVVFEICLKCMYDTLMSFLLKHVFKYICNICNEVAI